MKTFSIILLLAVCATAKSPDQLFDECYLLNDLEDNKPTLYYAERCRSVKGAIDCFTTHDTFTWYDSFVYDDYLKALKKLALDACVLARNTYCVANFLREKMRHCAEKNNVIAWSSVDEYYAQLHYSDLHESLLCMREAVLICPDDEQLNPYLCGIDIWTAQLNNMTNRVHSPPPECSPVVSADIPPLELPTPESNSKSTMKLERDILHYVSYISIGILNTLVIHW